jgi:hypothetical protein
MAEIRGKTWRIRSSNQVKTPGEEPIHKSPGILSAQTSLHVAAIAGLKPSAGVNLLVCQTPFKANRANSVSEMGDS